MRATTILLLLVLAGCASNTGLSGYCSVFPLRGGKAVPIGLIRLDPEMERTLRSQLPRGQGSGHICWYTFGDQLIAAGPRRPDLGNSGYVFSRRGDVWVLSSSAPLILALPKVIE